MIRIPSVCKIILLHTLLCAPAHLVFGQWLQSTNAARFEDNGGNFLTFGSRLYAFTSFGTLISRDNGISWKYIVIDSSASPGGGQFMYAKDGQLYWIWQNAVIKNDTVLSDTMLVFFSSDSGITWSETSSLFPQPPISKFLGAYDFTISGSNLLVGTDFGIFFSSDNGISWINSNATTQGVYCFAIDGNTVYAGSKIGLLWSIDNGITWYVRNSKHQYNSYDNADLVARDGKLFDLQGLSPDSGKTWIPTTVPGSTSLFGYGPYLFTTSNDAQGKLYVSSNDGTIWSDISGDFARAMRGIVSGPNIVVGTTTTGIWYAPLDALGISSVTLKDSKESVSLFPNPTNGPVAINGVAGAVTVTNMLGESIVHDASSIARGENVELDLSRLPAGTYFARIETPDGMVVRKILKE